MKNIVILKSRIAHMGGLERYAKAIALSFFKKGHNVTLLTTGPLIVIEGVKVLSLGAHPSSTFQSLIFFEKAARAWLDKFPQDIIFGLDRNTFQTHYRAGNGAHHTYLHQNNPSFLARLRAFINPKDRKILTSEKALFENPSLKQLFTNSFMVRSELLNLFEINPEKVQVIHNGVDFEKFSFDKHSKKQAEKLLGILPSKTHFLFVGNNYKRKGLDLILKALKEFRDKDFQLSIVGKDKNIKKYKLLAKKYLLHDKVYFWGPQPDLLPFYRSSDCLLLPSLYDPFANVTVEALAMGLFVVTSSFNGGCEVLKQESGYTLSNIKTPFELIKILNEVFSFQWDYSKRLNTRKTIQHLEINTQLDKMAQLALNGF